MSRALIVKGADFSTNAVARINQVLPYDAEVTYLASDGSSYIDLGIKPSSSMKFVLNVNIASTNKNTAIFGARNDTYVANYVLFYDYASQDKNFVLRYGTQIDTHVNHGGATGDFVIRTDNDENKMYVSGAAEGSVTLPNETFSTSYNLCMFGMNKSGTVETFDANIVKIKSFKLYDGSTLVGDFIPVRVGQVGYLYDKVSKELFGNAAESGALVIGADK